MSEANHRYRSSCQILLGLFWVTLLILSVKIWAAWMTRSLSLAAESLRTLLDSFSILLSLLSVFTSRQLAGRELWVHRKTETILVLGLTAFLGLVSLHIIERSLERLLNWWQYRSLIDVLAVDFFFVLFFGTIVAIHVCLVLFERHEGQLLNSPSLRMNARFMLSGVWLTCLEVIVLMAIAQGWEWLDPLLAIGLLGMAYRSLWRLLNWQLPSLVHQVAIAPEAIAALACQVEGVTACNQIRSQGVVGQQVFIQMNLMLKPEFMQVAQLIAERVEMAIRERYGPAFIRVRVQSVQPAKKLE